jgi:hypothetical protein
LVNSLSLVKDAQVTTNPDNTFETNIKVVNVQDKNGNRHTLTSSLSGKEQRFRLLDETGSQCVVCGDKGTLTFNHNNQSFSYSPKKFFFEKANNAEASLEHNKHVDNALSKQVFETLNTLFEAVK